MRGVLNLFSSGISENLSVVAGFTGSRRGDSPSQSGMGNYQKCGMDPISMELPFWKSPLKELETTPNQPPQEEGITL